MLLVHAHPGDETINNGSTMALYAALGAQVTLVTCTRGEEGEVLIPDLEHLAASATDALGDHRVIELAEAMKALGVSDHRFLGEDQQGVAVHLAVVGHAKARVVAPEVGPVTALAKHQQPVVAQAVLDIAARPALIKRFQIGSVWAFGTLGPSF